VYMCTCVGEQSAKGIPRGDMANHRKICPKEVRIHMVIKQHSLAMLLIFKIRLIQETECHYLPVGCQVKTQRMKVEKHCQTPTTIMQHMAHVLKASEPFANNSQQFLLKLISDCESAQKCEEEKWTTVLQANHNLRLEIKQLRKDFLQLAEAMVLQKNQLHFCRKRLGY